MALDISASEASGVSRCLLSASGFGQSPSVPRWETCEQSPSSVSAGEGSSPGAAAGGFLALFLPSLPGTTPLTLSGTPPRPPRAPGFSSGLVPPRRALSRSDRRGLKAIWLQSSGWRQILNPITCSLAGTGLPGMSAEPLRLLPKRHRPPGSAWLWDSSCPRRACHGHKDPFHGCFRVESGNAAPAKPPWCQPSHARGPAAGQAAGILAVGPCCGCHFCVLPFGNPGAAPRPTLLQAQLLRDSDHRNPRETPAFSGQR